MKIVTFSAADGTRPGLLRDDGSVVDIDATLGKRGLTPCRSVLGLIDGGAGILAALAELSDAPDAVIVPAAKAMLVAPIPRPRKNVFCVGRNYKEHVAEAAEARGRDMKLPAAPQYFSKPPTTVIGPDADIPLHADITSNLDYEVELAVVIGKRGVDIPRGRALDYVFGYTIIDDITARELQRRHDQWFKGKGLDKSCPMGPYIVPAGEVPDPQALDIWLTVNGEVRQKSNTRMMIFPLDELIATLSQGLTLEPGDIIATGTPSGVGFAMKPPRTLAGRRRDRGARRGPRHVTQPRKGMRRISRRERRAGHG